MNQKTKEAMCDKIIESNKPKHPYESLQGLTSCFYALAVLGIGLSILSDTANAIKD